MNYKVKRFSSLFLLTVACLAVFCACCKTRPYTDVSRYAAPPESSPAVSMPDFSSYRKQVSFLGCGDNIIYKGTVKEAAANAEKGGREYNFKPARVMN